MGYRAKRSVLTLHRKIAKDAARTIEANSKGGRYYRSTVADSLLRARVSIDNSDLFRYKAK